MDNSFPLNTQTDIFSTMGMKKAMQLREQAGSVDSQSKQQLKELATQFESVFSQYLMKSMRETVPKTGMLDSYATNMYEQMLDEEFAKESSKSQGIGLADMIFNELSRKDDILKGIIEQPTVDLSTPPKFYDLNVERANETARAKSVRGADREGSGL
ncbi:MAG: hypothetical protein G3M78_03090 [Candidatus Nitrohelix vancouverensis]|uniref:Flagellar protein FlgJ N-terminal domain-containing protein n=1 Tax=Candidatus Nitrohelix vancouverensis TaxID=2705534 RepID=A0A7T0C0R7_9BACT|nr:MAG: hypothetical protein G3M78_03090 [Candidatus Nitrohelix vancouverensis]